ncbi:MAG: hypothetical protein WCC63_02940 [Candidatus Bathyarchaeia archaeon]
MADSNKEKVEKPIHQYIGEQASLGRCSPNWSKARKEIQANEQMEKEVTARLKTSA